MLLTVFFLLAGAAVGSAIVVVLHRNPVVSTMSLVVTLVATAGLFVMLGSPFLAALQILLYQLVTLKRGGEIVRLSKRGGEIITLDELVEEVGPDAARFFFLLRSPGAQMEFDLDLAKKQSSENPVFYVQYAHARLASILDRAAQRGLTPEGGDVSLLTQPSELALIREMMRLSDVVESVAQTYEPQQLPHYAMSLATAFHAFNDAFKQQNDPSLKVITEDIGRSKARLRLVLAAKIALARILGIMGMTAPDRM